MRPAAETLGDAAAVRELCRSFGVPCRVVHIPAGRVEQAGSAWGIGPEAAARFFRMRILFREARRINAAAILVAHTQDDALEHILLRVLRGAGPSGLAAMPQKRGLIVRPLLELSRVQVLAYLAEKNIAYRTDSTNNEIRYLRNRVRHKLVPVLDGFFPFWRKSLPGLAETQSRAADFITGEAARRVVWQRDSGGLVADLETFLAEAPVIKEEAFFLAADNIVSKKRALFSAPRRASLRCFLEQGAGQTRAADLGPVRIETSGSGIRVTRAGRRGFEYDFTVLIDAPGDYRVKNTLSLKVESLKQTGPDEPSANPEATGFHAAFYGAFYAQLPLVLRHAKRSDRIIKAGHKRRFSDIVGKETRREVFFTAEDREGVAAFIKTGRNSAVVCRRDRVSHGADCVFFINTGGIDA
jgi:tRNA(Ile)-lysidine synthase